MAEQDGVTTWTATRLQMIEALRQLPARPVVQQPARRRPTLRRASPVPHRVALPLAEEQVADLILAYLAEAESAGGHAEAIEQRDKQIRGLHEAGERKDTIIKGLRKDIDAAIDQRLAVAGTLRGVPGLSRSHGDDQAADVAELAGKYLEAAGENVTLREALASPPPAEPILDLAYLEDLTARLQRAEGQAVTARGALERLAAPGMNVTARRQVAAEALAELDAAAAGEQVAADEPA